MAIIQFNMTNNMKELIDELIYFRRVELDNKGAGLTEAIFELFFDELLGLEIEYKVTMSSIVEEAVIWANEELRAGALDCIRLMDKYKEKIKDRVDYSKCIEMRNNIYEKLSDLSMVFNKNNEEPLNLDQIIEMLLYNLYEIKDEARKDTLFQNTIDKADLEY